jgi:biotin operon repressor
MKRLGEVKVLFLDNLSCLFSGMRENDADDWERVLPWLLSFRRKKIAVVIVHHSGRTGNHMRGTSRREDAAFWTIGLSDSIKGREEKKEGARFLTRFTKDRNSVKGGETDPLDWQFTEMDRGNIKVEVLPADNMTIVLQLIADGLESCSMIAEEIGLSKGAVSKIAKKLEGRGEITISKGRKYEIKTGKH